MGAMERFADNQVRGKEIGGGQWAETGMAKEHLAAFDQIMGDDALSEFREERKEEREEDPFALFDQMMGDDIQWERGREEKGREAPHKLGEGEDAQETQEECYSTYEERIKQTPRKDSDRGTWAGERGESKYFPSDQEIKEILKKYGLDGIEYKNGIPDFSKVAEATVEIDHMTENRADNFRQCDEKCAEQWNKEGRDGRTDWTARDVAQWRKENGYTWHERNDRKTCDLVPTKINDYFGHLGGVAECRKRDEEGEEFDE